MRDVSRDPQSDLRRIRLPDSQRRKQTAYKLPPDLLEAFREAAANAGVTMTEVVEQGIRRFVDEQKTS